METMNVINVVLAQAAPSPAPKQRCPLQPVLISPFLARLRMLVCRAVGHDLIGRVFGHKLGDHCIQIHPDRRAYRESEEFLILLEI